MKFHFRFHPVVLLLAGTFLFRPVCAHAEAGAPWSRARELVERTAGVALADADRMESNRRALALAAVRRGEAALALEILALGSTYESADSYAAAALAGWPTCPRDNLESLISQGLSKVPLAAGYQPEEAKIALSKLAWVGGFPKLIEQAEAIRIANSSRSLREDLGRFRARYNESLWRRLLGWVQGEDGWRELKKLATPDETNAWKESRVLDGFSSQLLISEALRRAGEGQSYPHRWVTYAIQGMRTAFFNSAPLQNGVLAFRLALREKRWEDAKIVLAAVSDFSARTPAVSFPSYYALGDLAEAAGDDESARAVVLSVLQDKCQQVQRELNPYEKMLVYPQLAAGFVALGEIGQAASLREEALAILEKDVDPESKGVGLTRLWLSFAVGGDVPDKSFAGRMERQKLLVVGGG